MKNKEFKYPTLQWIEFKTNDVIFGVDMIPLFLDKKTSNCLGQFGFKSLRDISLRITSFSDLLSVHKFGVKSLINLFDFMNSIGFSTKDILDCDKKYRCQFIVDGNISSGDDVTPINND